MDGHADQHSHLSAYDARFDALERSGCALGYADVFPRRSLLKVSVSVQ
jgi:hypothetical protein